MLKCILPILLLAVLSSVSASTNEKPLSDGPVCQICSVVLQAAQQMLEQNKTETEVIDFVETHLCNKLGGLKSICDQYFETNGREIVYKLANKIDPTIICHNIGLCAFRKVAPNPALKPMTDSLNCTLCKLVFKQVQNALASNATQEKILEMIEQDLCNGTGSTSAACKQLIESFGPVLIKYVVKGLDPEKLCQLIGMCPSGKKTLREIMNLSSDPLKCVTCEYAVKFFDFELKNNKTDAAIISALEKVCNYVPASTKSDCDLLIETYGIYMIQLLIQFADPHKVCVTLKLC